MTISSKFVKGLIEKVLKTVMKKKLGVDFDITIHDVEITTDSKNVQFGIKAELLGSKEDVHNLLARKLQTI